MVDLPPGVRAGGLPLLLVASDQPPVAVVLGFTRRAPLEPALQPVDESTPELDLAVQRSDPDERAGCVHWLQPGDGWRRFLLEPPVPVLDPHTSHRSHAPLVRVASEHAV